MQYQLLNIINIPISKKNKILKKIILVLFVLFELLSIFSIINAFIQGNGNYSYFIDLITFPIFGYIVLLEIPEDHLDIVSLFLKFDDNKVEFFYPILKKNNKFNIYYDKIENVEYNEEQGILDIEYIDIDQKKKERIYFRQQEKETYYKIFEKHLKYEKKDTEIDDTKISKIDIEAF